MAVKASATVTLTHVVDIDTYYRYYLLQSSTAAKPGVPSVHPPASPWTKTEPGYTTGSTNSLYTVDCTVFSDGHFEYGPVQLSSSYEAAKKAYNEAKTASGNLDTFISTTYNSYVTNNDLELSSVKTKVESISVGGTNLLTGTAKIVAGNDVSRGNGTIIDGGPNGCQFVRTSAAWNGRHADVAAALARCGAKVGDKVTISCLVRIPQAPSVANSRIYLNRFDRDGGDLMAYFKDLPVGVWTRLSRTASVTEYMLGVSNTRFEPTTADVADFACWKLEMGTVATDWSPCPADVDYAMSKLVESAETLYYASGTNALPSKPTSQVTTTSNATVNGWTKTLPSYAADNNHTYLYTCQQMRLKDGSYSWTTPSTTLYPGYVSSQFTQTNNAITARVTTTEMNTKLDGYYTKTQTDSQIEARAESISLTVAQREIDKVSVGGRNFVLKSGVSKSVKNNYITYDLSDYGQTMVGVGEKVTISFDCKSDIGGHTVDCYVRALVNGKGKECNYRINLGPVGTDWGRYFATVTVHTAGGAFVGLRSNNSSSATVIFRNVKVESGTTATDWSPAPEDVDSSISSAKDAAISEAKSYTNAQLSLTSESITTTVAQQIKEVDVGGKNLVLLSGEEVENTAYNIKNYSLSEEINPGDVLSCTIWGTLAASKQFGVWLNGGSVVLCAPATMTTVAPGVYRWENVTVPSNASSYGAVNKKAINVYHYPSGTAGTGKITRIKVERGNKATGWSPAPEDMDGRVSGIESSLTERITTLETSSTQTAEGFEDRIKKTVERLDQTDKSLEGLASSVSEVTASFVKSTDSSGNALLTLKTTANAMEARLSNQKLEFVDQGTVVASAGGQAFEMPNAVVKSSLKIGKFAWVPVGDDGIALTFVG